MARAIALAWRGWGRVHPNPLVGAVVLRDGAVVGEGWHAEFGEHHAEAMALAAAGEAARGATLVVTLEPCRHHGKQPPCTDAIVAAGIAQVVIAVPDPNPAAAGGARQLAERGVDVTVGVLEAEARAQNAGFLRGHAHPERPWVALKLATSVDARIADATGRSQWISGEQARQWVHWLRAGFDAIGVGAATATTDDPALTVRGEVSARRAPRRVVFDRRLQLAVGSQLVRGARDVPVTVVCAPSMRAAPAADALRAAGVEVLAADSLVEAAAALRAAEVGTLLVEGGGRLASALLAEGLVDRFYWVQAPCWLGDAGRPAWPAVASPPLTEAVRWHVTERRPLGDDTLLVLDRH